MEKACFKCGARLPLSEFYIHSKMADRHLNKCKSCTKKDVRNRRVAKPEALSSYERLRFSRPERKEAQSDSQKRMKERNPEKTKARNAVSNAVRDGRLHKKPCKICGATKVQAHHHDYLKPLDVEWLCFKHHREHEHGQRVVAKG